MGADRRWEQTKTTLALLAAIIAFAAWLFELGQKQGGVMVSGDPVLGTIIQWIAVAVFTVTTVAWVWIAADMALGRRGPKFPRAFEKLSYREQPRERLLTANYTRTTHEANLRLRVRKSLDVHKVQVKASRAVSGAHIGIAKSDDEGTVWSLDYSGSPDADLAELSALTPLHLDRGYVLRLLIESYEPISIERVRVLKVKRRSTPQPTTAPAPAPPSSRESS